MYLTGAILARHWMYRVNPSLRQLSVNIFCFPVAESSLFHSIQCPV
jgi:hypothetical protein